jgi:hypothetical protein
MARVGRPPKNSGEKAERHRKQAREWYQRMSPEERRAYVQRRSKAAQRKADAKRDDNASPARKAYRKRAQAATAKAHKTAPPKPKTCQWPGCKSTNIELHHQGKDMWLCPRHHGERRTQMVGHSGRDRS